MEAAKGTSVDHLDYQVISDTVFGRVTERVGKSLVNKGAVEWGYVDLLHVCEGGGGGGQCRTTACMRGGAM